MESGGNSGGGALAAPGSDNPPFGRYARLNAMCEELRAENWDVTNSLGTLASPAVEEQSADQVTDEVG